MAKKSIAATAKSLTVNFGKLALDAQRVALMEMVRVYERAAQATKKAGKVSKNKASKNKTSKQKAKAGKKRLVKAGRKGGAAVKKRTKTSR